MDVTRLRTGEKVAGVSAVALLLIMFVFKWFGPVHANELKQTASGAYAYVENSNAWQSFGFIDIVLLIVVLAGIALVLVGASGTAINRAAATAITTVLGALGTILLLYRTITPPDLNGSSSGDASRKIGIFLGLIAVAGVALGGWLAAREARAAVAERRNRV